MRWNIMMWATKAVLSMLCMVPMFMMPKIVKPYGVAPEAVSFFYGASGLVGVFLWLAFTNKLSILSVDMGPKLIIAVPGFFFGAAASIFMYQALATAPNPGFVVPILNCATIVLVLIGILLSTVAPDKFPEVSLNYKQTIGLMMAFVGVALVVLFPTPPTP